MTDHPEKLELLKPGIFLIVFLLLLGCALFLLNSLSQQRKTQVYDQYRQETEQYIIKNRVNLLTLFDSFTNTPICYDYSYCPQSQTLREQIDKQISHDLKDWSSTMFIFKGNSGQTINLIRLSGEVREFYSYPEEKKVTVLKLLNGETDQIPWDDYSYELANKEVIIPVKDDSGRVVGAIVRGVIEEKSF